MAYDSVRARTVLFSSFSMNGAPGSYSSTWEFDGQEWTEMPACVHPLVYPRSAMAYDPLRQRVVLVGSYMETWEWDAICWRLVAPAQSPSPRSGYAVAYDAGVQRVVLFGGLSTQGPLSDTWSWDGVAWVQHAGAAPSARYGHMLAHDEARQRLILFGGEGSPVPLTMADTWEWSLATGWVQRIAPVQPRCRHGMAYDRVRQRVVVYGGGQHVLTNNGVYFAPATDTIEWNGAAWAVMPAANAPPPGEGKVLVFDEARQRILCLGANYWTSAPAALWEWDGVNWQQQGLNIMGSAGAMAFDSTRQRTVLVADRTIEWDGTRWLHPLPQPSPGIRSGHRVTYDAARQVTVLFGGSTPLMASDDTWLWDGTMWLNPQPPMRPSPRTHHGLAYDESRQRVVLFGGENSGLLRGDTWEWDGQSWLLRNTATSPGARSRLAMSYDPLRQHVLLFGSTINLNGGAGSLNDTWSWDGTTWIQHFPAHSPPTGYYAGYDGPNLCFDPGRQRMVIPGMWSATQPETWEWDGTDWTAFPGPPFPSYNSYFSGPTARDALGRLVYPPYFRGTAPSALAANSGTGCGGSGGPPGLTSSAPYRGNQAFRLELVHAAAHAPALLGLALAPASQPVGGGCTMWIGTPLSVIAWSTNAAGGATSLPVAIPSSASVLAATFHAQAIVLDASSPMGFALTSSRIISVGD